jgi:tetratricopeptide (TPR) repeat protein
VTTDTQDRAGPDFFVSYAQADRTWAEWIAWQLEEAGYSTVLQAWDFTAGTDWASEMQRAMTSAGKTIAVLSSNYLQSVYGEAEWRAAFASDPTGERGLLVPVRVENLRPPGLLQTRVYIDLVGLSQTDAASRLLESIRRDRARAKPERPPSFPGAPAATDAVPQFPRHGPNITNLPARNPNFTGREQLLESLRRELGTATNVAVTQARAIHGLGGVGKTELALEYAHRFATDYGIIWWIPAELRARVVAALAGLARRLDVSERAEQDEMVDRLFDELRGRGRWLLVYDNAQDQEGLTGLVPPGGDGHVLITSRDRAWGRIAAPLPLDVLRRAESVALLDRRTGHRDEAIAADLAELLGDLPLALEEAAAYIEATDISLSEYLRLARERTVELFGLDRPTGDEQRVATTWSVALERIRDQAPAAEALLDLCAFLAPEDIPRDVPMDYPERLPAPLAHAARDRLAYNEAVRLLGRYSLVTVAPATLSVHLLVQVVVRARLTPREERRWAETAVGLLRERFPDQSWEVPAWPECQRLLPHVLAATEHAERLKVASEEAGWLLDRASAYLLRRGQAHQARGIAERALALTEAAVGPNHPETGERHDALGRVLRNLDDLTGARQHMQEALRILKGSLGTDHTRVAVLRVTFAQVLQRLDDLETARSELEAALGTLETTLEPDHPDVGAVHAGIATLLWNQGRSVEAEERWGRALLIIEGAYGRNHPSAATIRSNLSNVLQERGDLRGARRQLELALAGLDASLGPGHVDTAGVRSKLGEVLRRLRQFNRARQVLEEGLTFAEANLGPDHPVVAILHGSLGQVMTDQGALAEARVELERALRVFEALGPPGRENVRILRDRLRRVDRDLGEGPGDRTPGP